MPTQSLDDYERDGFTVIRDLFSLTELERLRTAVEQVGTAATAAAEHGTQYLLDNKRFVDTGSCTVQFEYAEMDRTPRVIEPVDQLHPELDALVDDPRLVTPMQQILDTMELSLWTAKLNLKSGGGAGFGWHQDSPYWIHDCDHVDQLPNVMLLLDDQSVHNGCFRLIPRSHRQGMLPGTDDGTQLGGFYTDPGYFNEDNAFLCELPAGSLVFFSPHVVHGSFPNTSNQPRRALIYTYQPAAQPNLKRGTVRKIRSGAA